MKCEALFSLKNEKTIYQGPVVQSIISLMSSLVVKMFCSSKYNIKFTRTFAEKMWVAFANAKAIHIFFLQKY